MMSGLEVAGIILAMYPIFYKTIKDLCHSFKNMKVWRCFETTFDDFVLPVERQHISFSQNLEILLGPLDISQSERKSL